MMYEFDLRIYSSCYNDTAVQFAWLQFTLNVYTAQYLILGTKSNYLEKLTAFFDSMIEINLFFLSTRYKAII